MNYMYYSFSSFCSLASGQCLCGAVATAVVSATKAAVKCARVAFFVAACVQISVSMCVCVLYY